MYQHGRIEPRIRKSKYYWIKIPTIHAYSLVGFKDTLPSAARRKIALISIAFERSA